MADEQKAEEQLHLSEILGSTEVRAIDPTAATASILDKFRFLFENLRESAIVLNSKKQIVDANNSFELLSGYAREEVIGSKINKILNKIQLKRKNGSLIEIDFKELEIGENIVILLSNVSEKKLLDQNSELLRIIESTTADAIIRINKNGKIIEWNAAAKEMFGRDDFTGLNIKNLMGRGSKIKQLIDKASAESRAQKNNTNCVRSNGDAFEAEVSLLPVEGANVCIVKDISERTKLREQVSQAKEEYEQLVNNVTDIIFVIDKRGDIQYINYQFEKQLGHKQDSVKSMISIIHPEDLTKVIGALTDSQNNGKNIRDLEFRLQNSKRKWIYFSANAVPIKDNQTVIGFRGTVRNIDEKKKAEDKTEQIRRELERKNKELIELNRLKSEFVSNVSHDLRTPLTSIQGYAALLGNKSLGQMSKEQTEAAEIIHKESIRLAKLINDLLDISKLEAGAIVIHRRPFHLSILEERCSFRSLAEKKGLEIVWNTPDIIGEVEGDVDRIAQVLSNLVTNAIKFTERGSITVNAYPFDKKNVRIDVMDTGTGIPEKEQKNIFMRFYQAPGKVVKKEGSGLGLAIAKEIVELHGGQIWVESVVGKGSKFSFILPKAMRTQERIIDQKIDQSSDQKLPQQPIKE
jgi:PAS domain S-box-containing protein